MKDTKSALTPLPSDVAAEKSLVGMILSDVAAGKNATSLALIFAGLDDSDFYHPEMRSMVTILRDRHAQGLPTNMRAVLPDLLSGKVNIADAADAITSEAPPSELAYCIGRVKSAATMRKLWSVCDRTVQQITSASLNDDPQVLIGILKSQIDLCQTAASTKYGSSLKELLMDLVESVENGKPKAQPIPLGIQTIDQWCDGGPRRGQTIFLGALRHVGKTAFMRQVAINTARAGFHTLCQFMESSEEDEAAFCASILSGVQANAFRTNGEDQRSQKVIRGLQNACRHAGIPLHIDTESTLTIETVENRARLAKATRGLDVLMIDYLQLFSHQNTHRGQTREQMISEDARRLKVLGKELNCLLIVAGQLNDEVDPKEAPEIRHLRESKGPANHADIVLLMSAPDGIDHDPSEENPSQSKRQLWNRKWRGYGAFSKPFELLLDGKTQRFS